MTHMTDTAKISTLVVDDEPVARAGMRYMLAEVEWISCIGEAANGPAAIEAIDRLKPELVFLDIHMPGVLGTDVLRQVRHQPQVVFTTAYAQHAVTAFELGALDYLLKPFGEERLRATLDRVRTAFGEPRISSLNRFGEAMSHAPIVRAQRSQHRADCSGRHRVVRSRRRLYRRAYQPHTTFAASVA
jgi:two-component system LytT family response regulator